MKSNAGKTFFFFEDQIRRVSEETNMMIATGKWTSIGWKWAGLNMLIYFQTKLKKKI